MNSPIDPGSEDHPAQRDPTQRDPTQRDPTLSDPTLSDPTQSDPTQDYPPLPPTAQAAEPMLGEGPYGRPPAPGRAPFWGRTRQRTGRVLRHKATHLVAALLVGAGIGVGATALVMQGHHGDGFARISDSAQPDRAQGQLPWSHSPNNPGGQRGHGEGGGQRGGAYGR